MKLVRVDDDVHERLTKHAMWKVTLSDVISKALDCYEKQMKEEAPIRRKA